MVPRRAPSKPDPRLVPGDKKGFFYYDSPEQKRLIELRAKEANRSVSSYILHTLLSSAGDAAVQEERLKRASDEAERWRQDYWKVKGERDDLAQRVQDAGRLNQQLMLQLEKAASLKSDEHEVLHHDARAWKLLMAAKRDDGSYEPVLEKNILIELDVVDEPEYVKLIKDRLAYAADVGLIERVDLRGKTAYRWKEAP